jgi:hypothetical protein
VVGGRGVGVQCQCQCRSGEWSLISRPGGRREFFSSANQLSSAGGAKGGARAGRQGRLPDWSDDARPHLFVEQRGNGLRSQVATSEARQIQVQQF